MYKILFLSIVFLFIGCGGGENTHNIAPAIDKTVIIDQDSFDPDNLSAVLVGLYANKRLGYDVTILQTEAGISNYSNWLHTIAIQAYQPNTVAYGLSKNSNDRVFKHKIVTALLKNNYIGQNDTEVSNAYDILQQKLEESEDASVVYATGGKLIFLSKFISDPYRLVLFKLKVKEIIFGLGCSPIDKECSRDYNLASTTLAYSATKDVYSKLHNAVDFSAAVSIRSKAESLNMYKNPTTKERWLKLYYSTNVYGTFAEHGLGDLDSVFPAFGICNPTKVKGTLFLEKQSLKFLKNDGHDWLYSINCDMDKKMNNIITNLRR